ncbi:type II CRISPR RNA-guided endonuclease Cas9 [Liquorilactobacillus hordei]|uniref:CRISPR-associated endonuclease Cas9 n=1 Tax=Liquorilactobacillus hordei DSM 19519 TaxID=1423759 RepID=A0A0R1MEL8_9LACO|nr:type II CRISPR RNA-guided endonuclease Cas9 [Liquorilactobacillus hordei]KRL06599.1 CRISPR associated protein [Liquorilactobacillus hordei DSM 19519]QYH52984.1 type II CRISPR RNA-guided endonuclease Cas9 [Liquorilactobacillus hordei DSM 19519]
MENNRYNVGLDIGTSSIGFAVTDEQDELVQVKGKNYIGVRLFKEGQTASERRSFRTTRRRLKRRKWRLGLLEEIFAPYLAQGDPYFLARMKESNISPRDERKKYYGSLLFSDDTVFYDKYPTVYHLRHALMTEDRKFDIREIYLAVHHIIKYRGNFLINTLINEFSSKAVDFKKDADILNDLFEQFYISDINDSFQLNTADMNEISELLLDNSKTRLDRQRESLKKLAKKVDDISVAKKHQKIATEFSKAILGNKAKFDVILNVTTDSSNDWSFKLEDEDADEKIVVLLEELNTPQQEALNIIHQWYSQISLNGIVPDGKSISEAMISSYELHKEHLALLKQQINNTKDKKKAHGLHEAYNEYVHGNNNKKLNQADFYSKVKQNLESSLITDEILELINAENFMPKQRTSANGVIPHQLHQQELDRIIQNQAKYYPFLAETNPNEKRSKVAKYKLDELVAFRVPYYVGPLITATDQKKTSGKEFAWMVRKQPGRITPWNFDEKVNKMESANTFIRRMTTKDSYLIAEDVLPDESLLYQKFKVLNELNNLRADGRKLKVSVKQKVFKELFQQQKTITIVKLQNYLKAECSFLTTPEISGLSKPEHFVSSLATYIDLKKIFGEDIDNPARQNDFERMIEWATIFEDKNIYSEKLNEIKWLNDRQKKELKNKNYHGWGKLSAKLLKGLRDSDECSIIEHMWNTQQNFMQVQAEEDFAQRIQEENNQHLKGNTLEEVLADAYTSPQNKKAIRQVVKVIEDIQKAMGGIAPQKISIEFTRAPEEKPRRSVERQQQIEKIYKSVANEVENAGVKDELQRFSDRKQTLTDKYFLYFTQLGKDMYTGKSINIDQIGNYQIDHILPQAFIKDDSLDNRVLVSAAVNNGKSDNVPTKNDRYKVREHGQRLYDQGLISKRKFNNLITDPDSINKFTARGFVKRQLVETSQVIRLVAEFLYNKYQSKSEIIEVRAKMNSQLRKDFGLIKNRNVNDYHHALDAYLTTFIGNYLYRRYPKLRAYFTYGCFKKVDDSQLKYFNFLHDIEDDKKKIIKDNDTGEILWHRDEGIARFKRIYNFKYMLVTHEVLTRQGAMFKQTVYSAAVAGSKKLIPVKEDRPIDIYGGYTNNNDAFLAIVKVTKKKQYMVVGIPQRAVVKLNDAAKQGSKAYQKVLYNVIKPQFIKKKKDRKTGKITQKLENFEIVVSKTLYRQLIIDGDQKYMLGSSAYKYNAKQLVLSEYALEVLDRSIFEKKEYTTVDLDNVYDEILAQVDKYFSLYDKNKFRQKLHESRKIFTELPINNLFSGTKLLKSGKRETLNEILEGLHANATKKDLKSLKFSTPLGMIQYPSGIILSENAILCYQSPTGIFERRVTLKDL